MTFSASKVLIYSITVTPLRQQNVDRSIFFIYFAILFACFFHLELFAYVLFAYFMF